VGPPILDRATFDAVAAAIEGRRPLGRSPRKDTRAMLLGVAFCSVCGGKMYMNPAPKHRPASAPRYVCRGPRRGWYCSSKPSMRADWLEEYVVGEYLRLAGEVNEVVEINHGGYDSRPELEEVRREPADHMADRDLFKSETGKREWRARAAALESRAEVLESAPVIPPSAEVRPTGRALADAWHATEGSLERRALLLQAGVRVEVQPGRRGGDHAQRDDDRLSFDMGRYGKPEAVARQEIEYEESAGLLQQADPALDLVSAFVELAVEAGPATAAAAASQAVSGLVALLRDGVWDLPTPQVGPMR